MPNSPLVVENSHYVLFSKDFELLPFSYYVEVPRVTYNLACLGVIGIINTIDIRKRKQN